VNNVCIRLYIQYLQDVNTKDKLIPMVRTSTMSATSVHVLIDL